MRPSYLNSIWILIDQAVTGRIHYSGRDAVGIDRKIFRSTSLTPMKSHTDNTLFRENVTAKNQSRGETKTS